jgi:hypothetical protein
MVRILFGEWNTRWLYDSFNQTDMSFWFAEFHVASYLDSPGSPMAPAVANAVGFQDVSYFFCSLQGLLRHKIITTNATSTIYSPSNVVVCKFSIAYWQLYSPDPVTIPSFTTGPGTLYVPVPGASYQLQYKERYQVQPSTCHRVPGTFDWLTDWFDSQVLRCTGASTWCCPWYQQYQPAASVPRTCMCMCMCIW